MSMLQLNTELMVLSNQSRIAVYADETLHPSRSIGMPVRHRKEGPWRYKVRLLSLDSAVLAQPEERQGIVLCPTVCRYFAVDV
jgi:hypothetical protein